MPNLTFTLRLAVSADLDKLWPMVRRAVAKMNAEGSDQWGEDYPTPDFYTEDIEAGRLWVAAAPDGQILGVAALTTEPEEHYAAVPWQIPGPAMVIHRMAVDPDAQRCGVASAFFRHAEGLARAQGVPVLHLDTYSKNAGMQALVLGRGYTKAGEIRLHFRPFPFPCFEKIL